MDSYFLVFQSLGPVELLILFGLAPVAWAVWGLTRGFRSRQEQITARPNPDEPLQAHITWYVHGGYRVVSQSDATAQLVKPKEFSIGWAALWGLLFFGVGTLVYVFYYATKSDNTAYLTVGPDRLVTVVER